MCMVSKKFIFKKVSTWHKTSDFEMFLEKNNNHTISYCSIYHIAPSACRRGGGIHMSVPSSDMVDWLPREVTLGIEVRE